MDDEVSIRCLDPIHKRRPVVVEMRLLGAEVSVGDLDDFHRGCSLVRERAQRRGTLLCSLFNAGLCQARNTVFHRRFFFVAQLSRR